VENNVWFVLGKKSAFRVVCSGAISDPLIVSLPFGRPSKYEMKYSYQGSITTSNTWPDYVGIQLRQCVTMINVLNKSNSVVIL
jgi:hypothetical protein